MAPRSKDQFSTVRTEGAILPVELLQRILAGDSSVPGLSSEAYHLAGNERLNEAATRAWNRLTGVWESFRTSTEELPEDAPGTTETRRWLLILFQELGYGRLQRQDAVDIEGRAYPISHGATEPVPIHLVSCRQDLDRRTPGRAGAARVSPHSLVQEFLNRSDGYLWGFVSNGLKLRVLRDNVSLTRMAYVEFDLEAMLEGNAYSDFFLLYLLCHQSRVEVGQDEDTGKPKSPATCWLEKWYDTAVTEGVRFLEELRGGVESAIETLGGGFLAHPANRELRDRLRSGELTTLDYYRQVLREVYRLLFLFVAEDRDLLLTPDAPEAARSVFTRYYSTARLREMAGRRRGTRHGDLWQQLNLVFGRLRDGCPDLGLPALGSFLFGPEATSDLDECQLANVDLLAVLRHLAYTTKNNVLQPVSYRNLGPEELGSVYESLLEMHPEIHLESARFDLEVAAGSERKTTGSYYTPSSLVNCLLDSALDPVLDEAVKGTRRTSGALPQTPPGRRDSPDPSNLDARTPQTRGTPANSAHPLPSASRNAEGSAQTAMGFQRDTSLWQGRGDSVPASPEQRILALKVCDPACGSGHFLIAAAHRIAKRLAAVRSGEDEPSPAGVQHALRDVIGHCIYGVDINPMAVELCKVSLWLEALEPGKPLSFLDHHIQCGNSLIGCTPALLKRGIPDDAFKAIEGDDKAFCSELRKRNRDERKGQENFLGDLFMVAEEPVAYGTDLGVRITEIDAVDDSTIEAVQVKEKTFRQLQDSEEFRHARLACDLWCAAFVWQKVPTSELPYPPTEQVLRRVERKPAECPDWMQAEVNRLGAEYGIFHWHLAFPDVFRPKPATGIDEDDTTGWDGGFDVVLGNPPWETMEFKEQEFFAVRAAEIADAPNAKARKRLIEALQEGDPLLWEGLAGARRKADGEKSLIRDSDRFPLCGRGKINTYSVFTELMRSVLSPYGCLGCIVPSGIATDDTTKYFFQDLIETGSLSSLYHFENEDRVFPGLHHAYRFCLLTVTGKLVSVLSAKFAVYARQVADLHDLRRTYHLTSIDFARINPNTRNLPMFRTRKDAELARSAYHRLPVLIAEGDVENGNPWLVSFSQGLFNMSSDSGLFRTRKQLEAEGCRLRGNVFEHEGGGGQYLPLYEAKMIHHFEHRFGTYEGQTEAQARQGKLPECTAEQLADPDFVDLPRYWVTELEISEKLKDRWDRGWLLGWRDITGSEKARTVISCVIPAVAVGHTMPLCLSMVDPPTLAALASCFSSYALDYNSRLKVGGTHLTYGYMKQLPVPPPESFSCSCAWFPSGSLSSWLLPRVIELTYTAWDLEAFAQDCGFDGPPFIWDEPRRFEIRCELDAAFFHLYLGTPDEWREKGSAELLDYFPSPRDAVSYIMGTFPIVRRRDEQAHGHYRTKDRILQLYDAMQTAIDTGVSFRSSLDPLPGPPVDTDGNFIPMAEWDTSNWPKHIHSPRTTELARPARQDQH
jgi:hypothetical protein